MKMTRRAYFKKPIYYGEEFEKEIEKFESYIDLDDRHFKEIKQKHRFSAVIRRWIQIYNARFEKEMLDKQPEPK